MRKLVDCCRPVSGAFKIHFYTHYLGNNGGGFITHKSWQDGTGIWWPMPWNLGDSAGLWWQSRKPVQWATSYPFDCPVLACKQWLMATA